MSFSVTRPGRDGAVKAFQFEVSNLATKRCFFNLRIETNETEFSGFLGLKKKTIQTVKEYIVTADIDEKKARQRIKDAVERIAAFSPGAYRRLFDILNVEGASPTVQLGHLINYAIPYSSMNRYCFGL